jgi:SHS2 domain-containing protein
VELTAPDEEDLLVAWLNELIYLFDTENILFKRFEVTVLDNRLKARVYGEKVDSSRHRLKTGVKGATYHMLGVSKGDSGCRVQVIFDI